MVESFYLHALVLGGVFAFDCSQKVFKSVKKQFSKHGPEPKIRGKVKATARSRGFDTDTASVLRHSSRITQNSSVLFYQAVWLRLVMTT